MKAWVKTIPAAYIVLINKTKVEKTRRVAATMPLVKVRSSGTLRISRAIRVGRKSWSSRRMLRFEGGGLSPLPTF